MWTTTYHVTLFVNKWEWKFHRSQCRGFYCVCGSSFWFTGNTLHNLHSASISTKSNRPSGMRCSTITFCCYLVQLCSWNTRRDRVNVHLQQSLNVQWTKVRQDIAMGIPRWQNRLILSCTQYRIIFTIVIIIWLNSCDYNNGRCCS